MKNEESGKEEAANTGAVTLLTKEDSARVADCIITAIGPLDSVALSRAIEQGVTHGVLTVFDPQDNRNSCWNPHWVVDIYESMCNQIVDAVERRLRKMTDLIHDSELEANRRRL